MKVENVPNLIASAQINWAWLAWLRIDDLAGSGVILIRAVLEIVQKAWSSVVEVEIEGAVLKEHLCFKTV